ESGDAHQEEHLDSDAETEIDDNTIPQNAMDFSCQNAMLENFWQQDDYDKALLMEAKEKGDVLDAEAEAFLADVECTAPYDQPQH
ncbi:hypothetical protein Tco_0455107, partial [Tanacetum coccineum]